MLIGLIALGASCSSNSSSGDEAAEASEADEAQEANEADDSTGLTASTVPSDDDTEANGSESSDTDEAEPAATTDSTEPPETTVEPPAGYCQDVTSTVIRFEPGAASSTIDGTADTDQPDRYRLQVADDQILSVTVTASDPEVTGTVLAPGATEPSAGSTEQVVAPTEAGDYQICVSTEAASSPYQLLVSVIDDNTPTRIDAPWCGATVNDRGEIGFESGRTSATVDNGVLRDERDLYSFEADADQNVELLMESLEDNARFDLRTPSGDTIEREVSEVRVSLPESGAYEICVGSARGNASYSLVVSIS